MSWAGEDWTVGLSGQVLRNVQQLQSQNEKLNKERQQRQLQLDNSEAALHKQKQKYEDMRLELAALQRELGGVREAAHADMQARERLVHEVQVKTSQVHSLEGQLESAKNLTQSLTQEIKQLEAELEKLQKGNGSGDSMLFSTPCWNMSSPCDHNGGFRVESENKSQHVRQLQFGDIPKPSVSRASSPFPQQPHNSPPLRRHVRQAEPSTPSSVFPWEREDVRSSPKGRPASCVSSSDIIMKNNDSGIEEALRKEIDDLRVRVSELKREAQLDSERLKEVESHLTQTHREISTKEQTLTRTQDQLTRAQTRITQESDRAQTAEQKAKQLQEELKCQRQNAESSRCNAEQRRKDMERDHQRELLELQRERHTLERQHQQESNRLNQEIQQARTLHNTLQAQYDKVCLQKQGLERDLVEVRGTLKNTETDLRESQKRETQTEAKLTEALRESESLTVSLGQMKKQEKALQEEVKRLTEELAEALKLIKELQAQLAAPPPAVSGPHISSAGDCFSPSISLHRDNSPPYQHSTQKKRTLKTGRTREEERKKYPSGREPGEGIDSEYIGNFDSEESRKRVITHQSGSLRMSETDVDISVTEQDTGISFTSGSINATMPKSESDISCSLLTDVGNDTSGNPEKCDAMFQKDLKKENAELRDELREVKYELQKRLEDLETQRRAETEARTKLKHLSRKHSTQTEQQRAKALELKESICKLETQLEQEKKETTKLRESLDVLEREAEKRQEENEKDDKEGTRLKEVLAEIEKKETSMKEEMVGMKKELEDLQLKLAQEREEREQEREEKRKQIRREEMEGLKIAQLQEELDNLRKSASLEEKISKDNLPVTYLQLERHLSTDKKALVENENDWQESICDSVNLQNTLVSKETRTMEVITDLGQQRTTTQSRTSTAEIGGTEAADMDSTTILVLEVERLKGARDREAEKAKLAQGKLEDLQKQVTKETKHLTQAFESQSRHIENLLRELHDKECTLQRQCEELQKCQEKICLLEETHTRENIILNKASTHPETSTEISRELSCDSVFSNTSISDHDIFNDDMPQILKVLQPSVQLPVEHSVNQTVEETNTSDISHKLQAVTEVSKLHELCLTSDIHCGNAPTSGTNSEAHALSEILDKNAKESEYSTVVSSHLQTEQSGVRNFQHDIPEPSTDDVSELERVTKQLQDAQLQLNVLKAQIDELVLEGGVAKEELLSIRQENEGLRLKLRHVDKDSISEQNAALAFIKNGKNGLSGTNTDGEQNSAPLGQEESDELENFKDGEMEQIKGTEESTRCEYDHSSKAKVDSLQEQIQALQAQIKHLSEQNKTQAEELELWNNSAMGETVGSNSSTIVLKEFEIFLPCRPTELHMQSQQTRTMMHQCTVTDMTYQCGLEDRNEQTNLGQHVSPETQMVNDVSESQRPAEDLMTANEKVMSKENVQQSNNVDHSNECPPVYVSDILTSNAKDKQSVSLTKLTDNDDSEAQRTASMSQNQTEAGAPRENGQRDALINVLFPTKVIISKPTTESHGPKDSQISGHNEVETMETAALDQHSHCRGDTTEQQNSYHTTVEVLVPSKNNSNAAQGQRVEVSNVTGDPNRMEVREVQSVSTQTEESREPLEKQPLLHASTQTDGVELEIEEDDKVPADSPPLPSVTDQLLLSKVFPMSNPAHLAERIRQNRSRMSAAHDDTEYEPYGLPEVVMKGFADIPSGPACPYVLRRGLLGTDAMPLPRREATPQEENEDIEP
ncbi:centromere protein F-like isoform X2 [Myxocyprinus asiaticus]|uniref:centromere protein F-like isoform X2 n=1 Tax=Myxocyprinus asiaticus TaxID=70543 RepID=UPI0022230001|nr:centromere protein F-like isoform X2 [Myxocyprinus asiaticus]